MSVALLICLVLLPVMMYLLAWSLAACRDWLGVVALPRARNVARSIRPGAQPTHGQSPGNPGHGI
jgi:hypothetical protein